MERPSAATARGATPTREDAGRDDGPGRAGVVLAADFGGSKVAVCVASPSGDLLDHAVVETEPALGATANFERGAALGERLAGRRRVVAVGACSFGVPGDGGAALSPAIEGWDLLPLRRLLEERFGAPAAVSNDVKAAAAAEARHGALAGCDPAVYVNLGTGLGAALVVGGTVLSGAHGAAGEIGYARLRAPVDGGPRVLEEVASGMALARALAAGRGVAAGDGGGTAARSRTAVGTRHVTELFDGAADGQGADPGVEEALEAFLDELAYHLVNLAVTVDPVRIAVGGGLVRGWYRMEPALRRALDEHVPYPPELVVGAYPFDAPLRGALDLGVRLAAEVPAG